MGFGRAILTQMYLVSSRQGIRLAHHRRQLRGDPGLITSHRRAELSAAPFLMSKQRESIEPEFPAWISRQRILVVATAPPSPAVTIMRPQKEARPSALGR